MSFEGYYQSVCDNGHLFHMDAYEDAECCPICGGKIPWQNLVDETNGENYGWLDMELFRIGRDDQNEPIYRIPSLKENIALRTYRDSETGRLVYTATPFEIAAAIKENRKQRTLFDDDKY